MPLTEAINRTVKFQGLDLLRCCAALSIVVYHSTLGFKDPRESAFGMLLHNLSAGVDFFFLISGFLITYLLLTEKDQAGTINLPRFYLRRALRIFPLYYAIIALGWWLHHPDTPDINFPSYLAFVGNFWMVKHGWTVATLNPLWSLCIEEQFYLVIPLLVLLIPTPRLPWLFGGIVLVSALFRAYTTGTNPDNWMTMYCHTLSRCDTLALGGLLAWIHFSRPLHWQLPRLALPVALLFLALLFSIVDATDFTTINLATNKKYLYLLPMAFIFCFTLFNNAPAVSHPAVAATGRAFDYLGKISYGLYMYHSPIIFLLDKHLGPRLGLYANNHRVHVLVILTVTILIATLSYELFEKQILRLKSRFEVVRTVRA